MNGGDVLIFGAGRYARDLAGVLAQQGRRVLAFVTSAAQPADAMRDGVPVRRVDAAALMAAPLWMGVFNREPASDYGALDSWLRTVQPAVRIVWPQSMDAELQSALGFRFWLHATRDYAGAAPAVEQARRLLADDASRAAFDAVLAFRRDALWFAQPPQPQAGPQYLPGWLCDRVRARGPLRIVDGGAFHGETVRELAAHVEIAEAWTFEPDAANHAALLRAMSGWPVPAAHHRAGLAERSGQRAFSAGGGEGSHFGGDDAGGGAPVAVVALDDVLRDTEPNFVKLDVEGCELQALAGARETLLRCRPTLAIAGYHRWDDLWRIPAWIAGLGVGYRLHFVVHGHNSFDTVFYAD